LLRNTIIFPQLRAATFKSWYVTSTPLPPRRSRKCCTCNCQIRHRKCNNYDDVLEESYNASGWVSSSRDSSLWITREAVLCV
jgi:hypothetical protein